MLNYFRHIFLFILFLLFSTCTNAQNIIFEQHAIDLNFPGAQCFKVVDLDADGDLDIIGGSQIIPNDVSIGIVWWRNEGGFPINWTRFSIDASFIHVMSVDVADINSDGYPDIIASSWQLHQVAWWKNSGNPEQGWTKYIVKNNYINAHDAKGVDIDQDGDTDIVMCNANPGSIDIAYNQSPAQPTWNNLQIESVFSSAKSVEIIDLDFDNDLDIVAAADGANDIAWWENTGNNSQVWQKTTIENFLQGVATIDIIDMNNDQRLDIIATAWQSNQVAYYICNDLAANDWTRTILTTTLGLPLRVRGWDFDNDGDVDIVATGHEPGEMELYINDNFNWTKQTLRENFGMAAALEIADFDQDGDQDIVAGAGAPRGVFFFENETITSVDDIGELPMQYMLEQNYPNPFNPATTIEFTLPDPGYVTLKIYDSLGREIKTLAADELNAGKHFYHFKATGFSSGVYIYRVETNNYAESRAMIYLK